jgi:phosphoesterase RecJ-like protein
MVADVIDELGVPWTQEIATHLYLGIATDTGGFRHGPISPRTFEICRRVAETGVDTSRLSRQIFDSFGIGRVKLTGRMLSNMELRHGSRLAVLEFDDALLAECGATVDDTEGLVNLPLGANEVKAVALFQVPGGRHLSRQPPLQTRRGRARRCHPLGAAAGTRTRRASPSPRRWTS